MVATFKGYSKLHMCGCTPCLQRVITCVSLLDARIDVHPPHALLDAWTMPYPA